MPESFQLPFGSREERIAYNESWSRSLNEDRAEWVLAKDAIGEFRCECWKQDCPEVISLTGEDWKFVRAKPNRFAVAPQHVAEASEAVVKAFPDFWLIEKLGEAGEVAEEMAASE
jgi:hypothetical protein